MAILELKNDDDWRRAFPALKTLRPNLAITTLLENRKEITRVGYTLIGLVVAKELVCVAGFVVQPHLEFGRELWIHDLATLPHHQRKGHARTVMTWLMNHARATDCFRISVHTRLHREGAQKFYESVGLTKTSIVFQGAVDRT